MNCNINTDEDIILLKALPEAFAPSGFEDEAAEIIIGYIKDFADKCTVTSDGSVIAKICGKNNVPNSSKLMIQAHMDEVGFMIKSADEGGTLRIAPIGLSDIRLLVGRKVTVSGAHGVKYPGFIGVRPVHLTSKCAVPEICDIYVDIGAKSREEALAAAPLGSFGTFASDFMTFGHENHMIGGKALSNRACCAVMCKIIRNLKTNDIPIPCDTYFAFTCRANTPVSSVQSAICRIKPTHSLSLIGSSEKKRGDGVILSPSAKEVPLDHTLFKDLQQISEKQGISHAVSASVDCRDALTAQRCGVSASVISFHCDGIGSETETAVLNDITALCELTRALIIDFSQITKL